MHITENDLCIGFVNDPVPLIASEMHAIAAENALRDSAKTLLEKPIVWIYNKNEDDAKSHGDDEVAVGFIPKDSPIEFRKLSDGRVMCSVIGKLWTRYSGRMMDVFKRDKSRGVIVTGKQIGRAHV